MSETVSVTITQQHDGKGARLGPDLGAEVADRR
jgi:hypothetical protein